MNIVFFGSSEFAVASLRVLVGSGHSVVSVVTQPDKKGGRNLNVVSPPVKTAAGSLGLGVVQPENASSSESVRRLKSLNADLFVVVAFGQILSDEVLSVPKRYSINLHGSLLPWYRGAAPINWAVINGDAKTGVTVMRMVGKMDAGDIIASQEIRLNTDETSEALGKRLAKAGSELLLATIAVIEQGKEEFITQDERYVTFAPKLKKTDGLIDWKKPAKRITNLVRGVLPWPGAYTHLGKKTLKILKTELVSEQAADDLKPGQVVGRIQGKGFTVQTGSSPILIKTLQLEGKKALDAEAFLRGHPLKRGDVLG
ncbi:MAG: methionyl-tRNA formyltransferase [Candidatus Omnitrophota bacterium]